MISDAVLTAVGSLLVFGCAFWGLWYLHEDDPPAQWLALSPAERLRLHVRLRFSPGLRRPFARRPR